MNHRTRIGRQGMRAAPGGRSGGGLAVLDVDGNGHAGVGVHDDCVAVHFGDYAVDRVQAGGSRGPDVRADGTPGRWQVDGAGRKVHAGLR